MDHLTTVQTHDDTPYGVSDTSVHFASCTCGWEGDWFADDAYAGGDAVDHAYAYSGTFLDQG